MPDYTPCVYDGWLVCQVIWTSPPRVEKWDTDRVTTDQRELVAEWLVGTLRGRGHHMTVGAAVRMLFGGK